MIMANFLPHIEGISEFFRLSLYMTSVLSKCSASFGLYRRIELICINGPYIIYQDYQRYKLDIPTKAKYGQFNKLIITLNPIELSQ